MTKNDSITLSNKLDALGIVTRGRPRPYREYDQIYMLDDDMISQIDVLCRYSRGKKIAFLGDGDGISVLLALLTNEDEYSRPESITIFDFDERILNNYKNIIKSNKFSIKLECVLQNFIEPIPKQYYNKYDFFYINPPYGSKNFGDSCISWLHRCFEACGCDRFDIDTNNPVQGCIVIPYDLNQYWTRKNMLNIQNFLSSHGFVVREMRPFMHRYHLQDNPELRSASLFVEQIEKTNLAYRGTNLSSESIKTLYGRERPVPHFIRDNGDECGYRDMEWEYGKEFW